MIMTRQYPSFDEVKDEIPKEDLIIFLERGIEGHDVELEINKWIRDNYEYTLVRDEDAEYEEMRDDIFS